MQIASKAACLFWAVLLGVPSSGLAESQLPAPKPKAGAASKTQTNEVAPVRRGNARGPAKNLFGGAKVPAALSARSIGGYARGCLAGGKALEIDGTNWQVMRLSRNRNWGHPTLIAYLERLAGDAPGLGWRGLMVGDLAQPRGGPMLTGHRSHQIGLDADIWLREMPARRLSRRERENISAISMLRKGTRTIDKRKWTDTHARLIRRAASDSKVARIFVHPAIKQALCQWDGAGNRSWLRKVRPWYGHHYHFHVRLRCPSGSDGCENQAAPPKGDGCGKELAWWLGDEPWRPATGPKKKRRELRLADLPGDCSAVLYR